MWFVSSPVLLPSHKLDLHIVIRCPVMQKQRMIKL